MGNASGYLLLEDGRQFEGRPIGVLALQKLSEQNVATIAGPVFGELVFNTSMTGYQEICTDPSYTEQIVCFTAPQIGNYGVNAADSQDPKHDKAALNAIIVRELSPMASGARCERDFVGWMVLNDIGGLSRIDTRAVTRHLRDKGAMRAGIFVGDLPADALDQVKAQQSMDGANLAAQVSADTKMSFEGGGSRTLLPRGRRQTVSMRAVGNDSSDGTAALGLSGPVAKASGKLWRVAVLDCGVKRGILESMKSSGIAAEVLPLATPSTDILSGGYDGVLLSNGPGDPAAVDIAVKVAQDLTGKIPLFGICLGYQIMALSLGAKTYKMPFGHHGGNHPVLDRTTGDIWITAQNHGFAVDPDTLTSVSKDIVLTHHSLYDQTLEGFKDESRCLRAVQFHPEGSPGPTDASVVFHQFCADMLRFSKAATS